MSDRVTGAPVFCTVLRDFEATLEEKRSVFLAYARRVSNEEEVNAFLKERRRAHPDARHTVYAYLLRDGAARYSDDSEPQGTAGMPTLEAIRRTGLSDVAVATTRYFGGILLGAGGLTRAYAGAAHAALTGAGVAEYHLFSYYSLDLSYPDHQKLTAELPRMGVTVKESDFSDRVRLRVGLLAACESDFCRRVTELTAGRTLPQKTGEGLDLLPQ